MLVKEIIYAVLGPLFNDRVGPHPLPLSFNKSETYITYSVVSGDPLNTVKNWTGHSQLRIQINIFNHDTIEAEQAKNEVVWAMTEQSHSSCTFISESDEGLDEETQLYQQQVDFLIWQEVSRRSSNG